MNVVRRAWIRLGTLIRNLGQHAMREELSKMAALRPLAGRYVQIGYGTKTIQTFSGVLEADSIDPSGVTLLQAETDRPIRLGMPDIHWVTDGTTGQEWSFH